MTLRQPSRKDIPQRLTVENLKLCPLCDSLNAKSNNSCFVCGWRGTFQSDPKKLIANLKLLMLQCPELADNVMFDSPVDRLKDRVLSFLARIFMRRKIDILA